jgi:hypothetical protein
MLALDSLVAAAAAGAAGAARLTSVVVGLRARLD